MFSYCHSFFKRIILFLSYCVAKGLNHESTLDLLDVIRRISDRGHLVIATMDSIPKGAAQRFDQIVLLDDKQVRKKGNRSSAPVTKKIRIIFFGFQKCEN